MYEQLELALFAPPSYDQILTRLNSHDLTVSTSRRLRRNWHVIIDRAERTRQLVVPEALAQAPESVKLALVEWARLPDVRRGKRLARTRQRRSDLEAMIWTYLTHVRGPEQKRHVIDPARYEGQTAGAKYDLREVFIQINRTYFDPAVHSYVRWGEYASLTSYQSDRTAPDGRRYSLITIAGAYDHPAVPRFAIEAVMFHEMLHARLPAPMKNGRRLVHGRDFKRAERAYPRLAEWERWQAHNLRRLAGQLKRRRTLEAKRKRSV